jgi:hypothetical protein
MKDNIALCETRISSFIKGEYGKYKRFRETYQSIEEKLLLAADLPPFEGFQKISEIMKVASEMITLDQQALTKAQKESHEHLDRIEELCSKVNNAFAKMSQENKSNLTFTVPLQKPRVPHII